MASSDTELASGWASFAGHLVLSLTAAGLVPDDAWGSALLDVPRHLFVPRFYRPQPAGGWAMHHCHPRYATSRWLSQIYGDSELVTDVTGSGPWGEPRAAAISPAPSLLLRGLSALQVTPRSRVLELGTGSGYTAALLSHHASTGQITSVEIDAEVQEFAAARLAALGHAPTLLCGDSMAVDLAAAVRRRARFDAILVGHTVDHIPDTWASLIRPRGRLLARLGGGLGAGHHFLLRSEPDPQRPGATASLSGRFLPWTHPVPVRRARARPRTRRPGRVPTGEPPPQVTYTDFDPTLLGANTPLLLLCQLLLPPGTTHTIRTGLDHRPLSVVATPSGAWAEIAHRSTSPGRYMARHSGSRTLLDALEGAQTVYLDYRRPRWREFGVSATAPSRAAAGSTAASANGGLIYLNHPVTGPRWPLPTEPTS